MEDTIKYKCNVCGQEHKEWPALTFITPTPYDVLSEDDKLEIAELDSDFCVITHVDQTDRFIRVTLTQRVIDNCQDLDYGLWVSLSEKNFQDYTENYNNEDYETIYFGWLSNDLLDYDNDVSIPTTVYTRTEGQRPYIVPHKDFEHPFVSDYYDGITKTEAERRINDMLSRVKDKD
jgi:hypothetical protein